MAKNTYIPRDEVVDMNKAFDKVRKEAAQEMMLIPGVLAVGVGLKQVKGEMQRELCFKVTVQKKSVEAKLKLNERIPDFIYGFKTDVDELTMTMPGGVDSKNYRPLIAGSQIGSSGHSLLGTLGCFAKRNSDSKIVVLSSWHALVDNPDAIDGDRAGQPSHNGCCTCCACNEIGATVDGRFKTDDMDAAICLLSGQESDTTPEVRYINEIFDIGIIAGSAAPLAGETVWKRGRTTGRTKGQVANDVVISNTPYEYYGGLEVSRTGLYEITPVTPADYFLNGDSGSVSVNEHNEAVILNFAFDPGTKKAYGCNIQNVESTLGISVLDSTFHKSETGPDGKTRSGVPLSAMATDRIILPDLASTFREHEEEIMQFHSGRQMLALFKKHQSEVLHLVNNNREVMAAWNRYQGPAFLANIARSLRRENKPVPEQIKGVSLQNLLLKMTAVLQRNGSDDLVKAVADNYIMVMEVLTAGSSPDDWKSFLKN